MKSKEYHNKKYKNLITNHGILFSFDHLDFKNLNEDTLIVEEKKLKSKEEDEKKMVDSLENKIEDEQSKLINKTPKMTTTLTNLTATNDTGSIIIKLFTIPCTVESR